VKPCPPVTPASFEHPIYKHRQQKVNVKRNYSFACNSEEFIGFILACFGSAFHENRLVTPLAGIRIWEMLL
jgi:hypothetical protein